MLLSSIIGYRSATHCKSVTVTDVSFSIYSQSSAIHSIVTRYYCISAEIRVGIYGKLFTTDTNAAAITTCSYIRIRKSLIT